MEAERVRKAEKARLKKKLGAKEAAKQADKAAKEVATLMHTKLANEEFEKKQLLERKKSVINQAEERARHLGEDKINDSKVVDQTFGFLPGNEDVNGGVGPKACGDSAGSKQQYILSEAESSSTEKYEDLKNFVFTNFATTNFQGQNNHNFQNKALDRPLLYHEDESDNMAALAVWITIQRFMGDQQDPKYGNKYENVLVMNKIYDTVGQGGLQNSSGSTAPESDIAKNGCKRKTLRRRIASMTLKKKSKITKEVAEPFLDGAEPDQSEPTSALKAEDKPTTNLDKLHFIIGHAIVRPDLRDEIYSQICQQLSRNPTKSSVTRGWVLLSLSLGCFAPSETFEKYLMNFIQSGPESTVKYCMKRLRRTIKNGTRHQPPSWLELQAVEFKHHLMLPITFMDGITKTLPADSATTSRELCGELTKKMDVRDAFGFSLYIALFDKVSSLRSSSDHVMDAISQCEQYAKEQGAEEQNAPWRLFFRKEIFSPWHNPTFDLMGTNLIYQQVIRGVKFGEYRCKTKKEFAEIAAKQYYIEHQDDLKLERIRSLIPNYIPDTYLQGPKASDMWTTIITTHYQKLSRRLREEYDATVMKINKGELPKNYIEENRDCREPKCLKEDIVIHAKFRWLLLFSRFYEAHRFSGPVLPRDDVIIAVNWTGVYIVGFEERVLVKWSFPELLAVTGGKVKYAYKFNEILRDKVVRRQFTDKGDKVEELDKVPGQSFTLSTVKGLEYTFTSSNAEDIQELISFFLDELKKRSPFVISKQDYQPTGDGASFLNLKKGDFIILEESKGEKIQCRPKVCCPFWSRGERAKITLDQAGEFSFNLENFLCRRH